MKYLIDIAVDLRIRNLPYTNSYNKDVENLNVYINLLKVKGLFSGDTEVIMNYFVSALQKAYEKNKK